VVLCSQKMVPAKLLKINFQFSYPRLRDALREVFS
jgi:NAD dependent epimerase/dehydratase family enzyme